MTGLQIPSQSERLSPAIVNTTKKGLAETEKNCVSKEAEMISEECTASTTTLS